MKQIYKIIFFITFFSNSQYTTAQDIIGAHLYLKHGITSSYYDINLNLYIDSNKEVYRPNALITMGGGFVTIPLINEVQINEHIKLKEYRYKAYPYGPGNPSMSFRDDVSTDSLLNLTTLDSLQAFGINTFVFGVLSPFDTLNAPICAPYPVYFTDSMGFLSYKMNCNSIVGDSLGYSFLSELGYISTTGEYDTTGISINGKTGVITFSPTLPRGKYILKVKVEQYKGYNNRTGSSNLVFIVNTDSSFLVNSQVIKKENPTISIYPSPNDGHFTIDGQQISQNYQASIYAMNGQLLQTLTLSSYEIKRVDLAGLPSGTYFVRCFNEEFSVVKKIIVY